MKYGHLSSFKHVISGSECKFNPVNNSEHKKIGHLQHSDYYLYFVLIRKTPSEVLYVELGMSLNGLSEFKDKDGQLLAKLG